MPKKNIYIYIYSVVYIILWDEGKGKQFLFQANERNTYQLRDDSHQIRSHMTPNIPGHTTLSDKRVDILVQCNPVGIWTLRSHGHMINYLLTNKWYRFYEKNSANNIKLIYHPSVFLDILLCIWNRTCPVYTAVCIRFLPIHENTCTWRSLDHTNCRSHICTHFGIHRRTFHEDKASRIVHLYTTKYV